MDTFLEENCDCNKNDDERYAAVRVVGAVAKFLSQKSSPCEAKWINLINTLTEDYALAIPQAQSTTIFANWSGPFGTCTTSDIKRTIPFEKVDDLIASECVDNSEFVPFTLEEYRASRQQAQEARAAEIAYLLKAFYSAIRSEAEEWNTEPKSFHVALDFDLSEEPYPIQSGVIEGLATSGWTLNPRPLCVPFRPQQLEPTACLYTITLKQ